MTPFLLTFLRSAEGLQLAAYKDADHWAIGYGHQIDPHTESYLMDAPITQAKAEGMLMTDAQHRLDAIDRLVAKTLTLLTHERESLASFSFNVGVRAFEDSTLLSRLLQRDYHGAAHELRRWCHTGGKPSEFLLKRRVAEELWFLGGSSDSVLDILTGEWRER